MEILIAEDDFISRSLLKKMLVEMGHEIIETENGQEAWNIVQQRKSRFIITDWMMPVMDGLELCRRIREGATDRYVYIIMLTAKDRKKDLVHVLQSGADDYIPKPFDPDELSARVSTGQRVLKLEEEHKKMHLTLIESRNKLRIVFDSLQELVVSLDPQFTIVSANKAFVEASLCKLEDLIGRDCMSFEAGSDILKACATEIKPLVEKMFGNGKVQRHLLEGSDSTGLKTYQQIVCLPVKNETGTVVQAVVVLKDITEDRRKADEINELNERLIETSSQIEAKNIKLETTLKRLEDTQTQMLQSEKMASIGQLAAGVAHEINNPTGFVSSNLKTLGDYQNDIKVLIQKYQDLLTDLNTPQVKPMMPPGLDEKRQAIEAYEKQIEIEFLIEDIADLITDCREGTERIKKIVMDLKDFAHPGEDKVQSVDINKGLESTLNVVNNEIKYKAVVHKELGDIPAVSGLPQQLNQVFMNILVNAAQAIEKKGEIHVKTQCVDGYVEITIRDTGCGIPEENLQKIFDPFFTTKDVGKGTGLGMNIAYNIVRKHNGSINVQSKIGEGTTFIVKIPSDSE